MADHSTETNTAEAIQQIEVPIEEFLEQIAFFTVRDEESEVVLAAQMKTLLSAEFVSGLGTTVSIAHITSDDESSDKAIELADDLMRLSKNGILFVTLAGPVFREGDQEVIQLAASEALISVDSQVDSTPLIERFRRLDVPSQVTNVATSQNGDVSLIRAYLLEISAQPRESSNLSPESGDPQIIHLENLSINPDLGDIFVLIPEPIKTRS